MEHVFGKLGADQINKLFPFYFVLNNRMEIVEYGRGFHKTTPLLAEDAFSKHFLWSRPHVESLTFNELKEYSDQLLVIQFKEKKEIKLRGQIEFFDNQDQCLFFGSIWMNEISQLKQSGLTMSDFAIYDPSIEFLQLLNNQEIVNSDIKSLLEKLNQQKKTLEQNTLELNKNQEELKLLSTIAQETSNTVMITDAQGHITWVNNSFSQLTGYTLQEIKGKTPGSVLQGPETDAATIVYLRQQVKNFQPFVCDILNYTKTGEKYWVKIQGHPITGSAGEAKGFFALEEDITQRRESEIKLQKAKEQAELASEHKNHFLATMSHEIRTPLNAIIGISNLVMLTNPPEELKENLGILQYSANNLLALVNDILDLSKIESGHIEFTSFPFELQQVVKGVYQTFQVKCEQKGIELESYIDPQIPEVISGDSLRLTQILNNLVNNAVKFTEKGSIRIQCSLKKKQNKKLLLRYEVTDSGIGIKKDRQQNIFQSFTQADANVVRGYGGTGLGLSICKQLIELQHGKIGVESNEHHGSAFWFELEFTESSKQKLHQQKDQVNEVSNYLSAAKVLVVEDNVINQKIALSYLKFWGATTSCAMHGKEAIQLFKENDYDILLVDLFMPEMDGFEAIENIRKMKGGADIPIIALTASAEVSVLNRALKSGATTCLGKPFDANALKNKLNELLGISFASNRAKQNKNPKDKTHKKTNLAFQHINLHRIQEASLGHQSFINDMLTLLQTEIPNLVHHLEEALQSQHYQDIASTAHKLKNNLYTLGMDQLKPILKNLEDFAREERNLPELSQLVDQVKLEWEKALPELEKATSQATP